MKRDPVIGAFLFPSVFEDSGSFLRLLDELGSFGINAIVTESDRYHDEVIDRVHRKGMRFFAGIACFSDHASEFAKLKSRPKLRPILETGERRPQMEWYIGLTPTDRRHHDEVLDNIHTIASRHAVDGLFLDFVRWPLHWEIELRKGRPAPLDSSFDAETIGDFVRFLGEAPSTGVTAPADVARWIRANHLESWIEFKCDVVTSFVREARSALQGTHPGLSLGAFLVPDGAFPSEPLTGQRLQDLAPELDWCAPMLYHNILERPPGWVASSLDRFVATAGQRTLPVLQVDSNRDPSLDADWGPEMNLENWKAVILSIVRRDDIGGLIVFPGTGLVQNGRGQLLRDCLEPLLGSESWLGKSGQGG